MMLNTIAALRSVEETVRIGADAVSYSGPGLGVDDKTIVILQSS